MALSDFLRASIANSFLAALPCSFPDDRCFFDWSFAFRFAPQNLPCSLSKPVSDSCCLYSGVHLAGKQVAATLIPSSLPKGGFASQVIVSLLHQQFTCIHLPDTQLPFSKRLFSVRSPPSPYGFSSAEYFDNPACTALPESQVACASLLHL